MEVNEEKEWIRTVGQKIDAIVDEIVEEALRSSSTYQEAYRYIHSLTFYARTDEINTVLKLARGKIRYTAFNNEIK